MENKEYKELNLSLNKIKDILIKNDLLIDFIFHVIQEM